MEHFLTIKEVIENYIAACEEKVSAPLQKMLVKALFAGMMIGMGAAASSVAAHSIDNVGLARLAASVIFPVGLMMVILTGAELFTGDCLMIMGTVSGKNNGIQLVKTLGIVYLGNLLGALILAAAVAASGQLDYSSGLLGAYTIKVAMGKAALPFGKALISGVLCNILVCAAVLMAMCAKDIAGKLLAVFFTIMLFVTAGFEHCVANMYYIGAGLIARLNPDYVQAAVMHYGYTAEELSVLNIKSFLIGNLLPVTIGNIIGGMLIIGLPLLYLNRNEEKEAGKVKEDENERGIIFGRSIADLRH